MNHLQDIDGITGESGDLKPFVDVVGKLLECDSAGHADLVEYEMVFEFWEQGVWVDELDCVYFAYFWFLFGIHACLLN